jgi:hypothetical protein
MCRTHDRLSTANKVMDGSISSGDPTGSAWSHHGYVHRRARAVAGTGDLPAAIALLDTGLAARDGSSDRAWADLTAYRDALAARQAAAERGRPVRPHRRGHSSATATSPRRTSPRPRPKAGSACGVS